MPIGVLIICVLLLQLSRGCAGIINGLPVKPDEYPYAVSVTYQKRSICAGILLSASFVLSPCHCYVIFSERGLKRVIETLPENEIVMYAGTIYSGLVADERQQFRVVNLILHHPQCANIKWTFLHDIALLRASEPFYPSVHIQFAELLSSQQTYLRKLILKISGNGICDVFGWGKTNVEYNGAYTKSSKILLKTEIRLISWQQCMFYLCRAPLRFCDKILFEKGILCALPISDSGTCIGDDGGALVCESEVLGFANKILSIGGQRLHCGELPDKPMIFTRIDPVYDFLTSQSYMQYS